MEPDVARTFRRVNAAPRLWKNLGTIGAQAVRFAQLYAQKSLAQDIEVLVPQAFLIDHSRMARESAEPFDRDLIAHLAVGGWLEMGVIGAVRP
jgi:hypothetical protein